MPYKKYNPKDIQKATTDSIQAKTAYKPPAISGAKPIAPNKNSKPFPSPFVTDKQADMGDDDVKMDEFKPKDELNKTIDGKVHKNKRKFDKKKWLRSGKANVNANLRRLIFPKAPWTILEELATNLALELNYKFLEPVEEEGMKLIPCEVTVSGDSYHGTAPEKEISKNIAAEMALQAYVVHAVNNTPTTPELSDPLDHAPWSALASLGLFKLFNDWQSRGFALPMMNPPKQQQQQQNQVKANKGENQQQGDFVMSPCKKLPDDPTSKHPVMLINEMYPGCEYDCGLRGGNEMFSVTVTIDGNMFTGQGRSKKDAKKECAMAAAKALLNIDYPRDATFNTN